MDVFLPSPRKGTGVTATEDEDRVVVRVAVGGVDHRENANLIPTLTKLIRNVKQHTSNVVSLKKESRIR